jgi:uncharacterized integral membrane protein
VKYLSWIITLPLLAIAVIFSVNHRQPVEIDLWPLPLAIEPPLYLVVLLILFVGFLVGGLIDWNAQGRNRRTARWRRYRIEELEREVAYLKRKLEKAEGDAKAAQGGGQATSNAPRLSGPSANQQSLPQAKTGS